ncbi:MAG: hypothetical protein AB9834_02640 [Lentimicrobium sp.]
MNAILKSILDFFIGGIREDMEYYKQKKMMKEEFCPNGCGKLQISDGKLKCDKCGWSKKD